MQQNSSVSYTGGLAFLATALERLIVDCNVPKAECIIDRKKLIKELKYKELPAAITFLMDSV